MILSSKNIMAGKREYNVLGGTLACGELDVPLIGLVNCS
jgi:hypothetical protein